MRFAHYIAFAWLASWTSATLAFDSWTLALVDTPASEVSLTPYLAVSAVGVYSSVS
jgi:hypothetical protein